MEFSVSMKRIQKFLLCDEINEEIVDYNSRELQNSNIAISLDNCSFYWGGIKKDSQETDDQKEKDKKSSKEKNKGSSWLKLSS